MKLKHLIVAALLFVAPFWAMATHVVGGSLTYEHLGGATYRITFKMYRDCGPSSIALPANVTIQVRQPNGTAFAPSKNFTMPKTQVAILNPVIDTCAFDPGVCVEEAIYTTIVNNLPPNPGGYHLYYTTCCRNASLVNVFDPLNTGEGFYTFIPDNTVYLTNSSPQWKNFTPVYVCQGNPLVFDHGATDKDGDSLAYAFYTPFDNNAPTFPGNVATFTPIIFNGGFTVNNPLGGGGFAVNPNTGVITGTPPTLGQYVVGVKVDEFRNGTLINTVYRDFQFNVLNCPPIPMPGIGPTTGCSGLAVPFTNTSTPLAGNSFYWDFGDLASTSDTSNLVNPSYAYPTIGTYIVMLVAQAGTPCADTIYDTLIVSGVTPDFTLSDTTCVNDPVNFVDTSVPTVNANVNSWVWDFGDAGSAVIPAPTYTYTTPGSYNVQLIVGTDQGCFDSITQTIFVQGLPIAVATDTFACVSNPVTNLNGTVIGASGGLWIGAGGFAPNTLDLNAAYTPTAAELAAGFSSIILSTTGNGFCPAATDTMILSFSIGITAAAGNDITVCKDSASIPLGGTIVTASGGQWVSSGSGSFVPNPFDLNAVYVPSTADTAAGSVDIYLNSVGNGNCTPQSDTLTISFTSTPTTTILSNDTACAGGLVIPISASSTTGTGYWQSLGTGFFTPNDSLNNTGYLADSLDGFNGNVILVFASTNNGGCQSFLDTLNITLIAGPTATATDTFTCVSGSPLNLNGSVTGATGGSWTGAGTFTPSITDLNAAYAPTAAELTAGFAVVVLSTTGNGNCIGVTDTLTITYSTGITAIAGSDISVCKDSASVPLGGSIITASGGQWVSGGSGTFVPNAFDLNAVYIPSSADTAVGAINIYLNSIGNGTCAPDSDTLVITFTPSPTTFILSNDTACAGIASIPIGASSTTGSGYWQTLGSGFFSPNDSLNNTGYIADSLDNFNGNVTLVFQSTNNGGCQSFSDTLNVTLIPAPAANYSFVSACPDDTVTFSDLSTSIDPITGWDWDFGNTFIDNVPNTSSVYTTAGSYNVSLIVTSANGCVDTSIQSVLIYSIPSANFGVNGVCVGVNSLFGDSSSVSGSNISTWQWDFGDSGTSTSQNPAYTYAGSGTYTVELIVQSAQGCWDTTSSLVTIQGSPTAGFTSSPGSVKINESFTFADISFSNVVDWQWDFGDGLGTSSQQNPTYSYSDAGNYNVCLVITDALGCVDSLCNDVIVFMPPAVPNAFSPNGAGENNIFSVLGGPYKEMEFRIYNNWGELIFESDQQSVGWDGTRDGTDQPVGVYIFTVRAITLDDESHTIKGDVTLLR